MLTEAFINEIKKRNLKIALLCEFDLTLDLITNTKTTKYFCSADIPIKYNDIVYEPYPFKLDDNVQISTSLSISDLTVVFDNVKKQLSSYFLDQDQRGNSFILKFASLDAQFNVLAIAEIFYGKIASIEINTKEIKLVIKHELMYWNNTSFRVYNTELFPNLATFKNYDLLKWGSE